MSEEIVNKNLGVIEVQPTETDFIAGIKGGIVFEKRVPSGDWTPWLPAGEPQYQSEQTAQYFHGLDTMACVPFSALNAIEIQINGFLKNNALPAPTVARLQALGFLDENGLFNASDRFTAKISGTTPAGNTLTAVADAIRHNGLVPEKLWPWDIKQTFDWNSYYAEIPDAVKAAGLEFLKLFDVAYEWVSNNPADIDQQLPHAPIQITTAVCPGWGTVNPVPACGGSQQHATVYYAPGMKIYDSYAPYQKQFGAGYKIYAAFKILITPKFMKQALEIYVVEGEQTLVIKNPAGKFYKVKTMPEFYPAVVRFLGIDPNKPFDKVSKAEVEAAFEGYYQFALAIIDK